MSHSTDKQQTRCLPDPEDGKGRIETGPTKFGDDWTGVFIRGDNAFGYAIALEEVIPRLDDDVIRKITLQDLLELLRSSYES